MNKPIVYIIVPVYNMEALLHRCMNSLLEQTHKNICILLVDDGSKDSSPAMCDAYARQDRRIQVIHQENKGVSATRNTGIEFCLKDSLNPEKDYLAFVDSDDFVHPEYIERLMHFCEDEGCDCVQCGFERGSADSFTSAPVPANISYSNGRDTLLGYRIKSIMWGKLYRLSQFQDLRFPIGRVNEEEFFLYKLVHKCQKMAFTDEKLYYYYERPGSIMHQMATKLRNNPRRYDWLIAFEERATYFRQDKQLMQRSYEKVCIELILRYTEQMALPAQQRDTAVNEGLYTRAYRNAYRKMISLSTIPFKRKLVYTAFYFLPLSAVLLSRVRPLRGGF